MLYTLKNIIKYSIYGDYAKFIYNNYFEDREIKELLKHSLTDNVDDREIYMKGIDNSYLYKKIPCI